ncbi:cytochrome d ubiquinol oxidase subunit II [Aneurinibacillus sp. Ricciae_BoGa-3]|uniref:cytochrome d ubiquinol oxidase subunit II n=1 Tax=Aneurinibacillus sp. Ricciae_BoGa-3 TaxID=3022697 RepID=UPI002342281D|nr:cytochrome d ubiquinol oxidase subunit II [Aneurinibacillus sp. Ricciae_BoGa-3]WCK54981.1 cytochrome d ubiquinol oxidase subunit II [Aneurinibacillus sp. Ricciae_BoGa-3]
MSYPLIKIIILGVFLYGYVLTVSIDFGARFFSYFSKWRGQDYTIGRIIDRYLPTIWELTIVFFILSIIGLVEFFPNAVFYYGEALLIPGASVVGLLIIRAMFYIGVSRGLQQTSPYRFIHSMIGLAIPAVLSTVLTISEGGFIKETQSGQVHFMFWDLIASPYTWTVILLSVVSVLFISAAFLAFYASKSADTKALEAFRGFALWWSGPTIFASLLVFSTLQIHNPLHFQMMLGLKFLFVLSFVCFIAAIYLIWKRKAWGTAFIMVMLQFGFAFFGYGASHMPYLLFPYVTIQSGQANTGMGLWLMVASVGGGCLLIPLLVLLMRLFFFNSRCEENTKG